ncbi:hypothetical protein GCM10014715_39500 [Streptomyces spiralis]|uniref:Uncharacterized protein n=1 Tax=Streptomyces spiralis TaxID=66376 RepID=A0A919A111_9ACTN|nr:hypothetical protein [Streptomyces spiralis]GHE80217.1 hypothetical protein GCM10014715_39500 [Streptomyces spiralis]
MPVSPKHSPQRAQVAFTPECEPVLRKLSAAELVRLDRALVAISLDPWIGQEKPTRAGHVPLREYIEGSARVIYHVTVLGSVVIVAYLEA